MLDMEEFADGHQVEIITTEILDLKKIRELVCKNELSRFEVIVQVHIPQMIAGDANCLTRLVIVDRPVSTFRKGMVKISKRHKFDQVYGMIFFIGIQIPVEKQQICGIVEFYRGSRRTYPE